MIRTFAICAAVSFAPCLSAQLLLGCHVSGAVDVLDPANGDRYPMTTIAGMGIVGELVLETSTGVVYAPSTSLHELYRVDLLTGTPALVGGFGIGDAYMHGLDYDLARDTLWGVAYSDGFLYEVDRATGAATPVGNTGLQGFVNIAYDLVHDTLWAADSVTDGLHTIDRATGAATLVGPMSGPTNCSSLTYDPITDRLLLADNGTGSLWLLDQATGAGTRLNFGTQGNTLGLMVMPSSRFVREDHACGGLDVDFSGAPLRGHTMTFSVPNATGIALLGFGLNEIGAPLCSACTIGHEWSVIVAGASASLSIPSNPALIGVAFAAQAGDLLATGGCSSPMVTLSDTLAFTIG